VKHFRTLIAAAALLVAFAAPSLADAEKFNIDNNHSVAGFQVRHFFAKVPGRFNEMSGTIMYDAKNVANSSVDVTIPAATINTQNERRDGHLKSADFFDVEKNPTITFKSTKVIAGKTADKFQVEGDLTMRGVTKKVTLDVTQLGVGSMGRGVVGGWEATTTVNRKDFGINWNRTLDQGGTLLGDDVTINLSIEANKDEPKKDAPPAATAK